MDKDVYLQYDEVTTRDRKMTTEMDGLLSDISGPIASITFDKPGKSNATDVDWIDPLKYPNER